jgi:D-serine deaminase-like pyridoxal phosphate-dependent protein
MKPLLDIDWAEMADLSKISSPALLFGAEAIEYNLRRMVVMAGDITRLRPHVKTHKSAKLVKEQMTLGIGRFKCATITEAEMCGRAGAPDVLLAMQPVGPNLRNFWLLQRDFPKTRFATIVDDPKVAQALALLAARAGRPFEVYVDLNVGQGRTGIEPGPGAIALYQMIHQARALRAAGLHAYDGHINQSSRPEREAACEAAFIPVMALRDELIRLNMQVPGMVFGGTPTFPIHVLRPGVECSPGTSVLWDAGYASKYPDLNFRIAAVLLARVISKPGKDRICLDLGHKAVASEMPQPRVIFPKLPDAEVLAHNEEHLVLSSPNASRFGLGDILLGIPWHICPTVALHGEAIVIQGGRVAGTEKIEARARKVSL